MAASLARIGQCTNVNGSGRRAAAAQGWRMPKRIHGKRALLRSRERSPLRDQEDRRLPQWLLRQRPLLLGGQGRKLCVSKDQRLPYRFLLQRRILLGLPISADSNEDLLRNLDRSPCISLPRGWLGSRRGILAIRSHETFSASLGRSDIPLRAEAQCPA